MILGGFVLIASQLAVNFIPIQLPNKRLLSLSLISIILYFFLTKLSSKRHLMRNCILTILIFGTTICITKPVQFGLDEEAHLRTTVRIADSGVFKREKEELHDYSTVIDYDILRNPDGYKGMDSWMTATHKPSKFDGKITGINNLSFIPSAVGWNIGKIFSDKIFVSYYLGRIFNLFAYLLLVLLAFKISKAYKKMIYLLAAFPATIFTCAGYHYDYLYFGLALILAAMFTNILSSEKKISKKDILLFEFVCLLFIFPKFPFILMGSLIIFLPKKYYVNVKDRIFAFGIFFLTGIIGGVYYISGTLLRHVFNVVTTPEILTEPKPTIIFFLKHPLPVIRTLINSLSAALNNFANPLNYVTNNAQLLNTVSTILFIFLFVMISRSLSFKIPAWFKLFISSLFLVITILIIYAIAGDSRVFKIGDLFVGGVQGRYYYLFIMFIPLLLSSPLEKVLGKFELTSEDCSTQFLQYSLAFLNILTLGIALFIQIPHKL